MPTGRESCRVCGRPNPVGFSVSDELWTAAVPQRYREDPLCVMCFAAFADDRGLMWDSAIKFYPISLYTHLRGEGPS